MSQTPGNSRPHLGEGGTHEVEFSNTGGKVVIKTVSTGDATGEEVKHTRAELGIDDEADNPTDHLERTRGEDDADDGNPPPTGKPKPFSISVPGLKKTVPGA